MQKEFYSTVEAAKILRVSRKNVFERVRAGKIRATKVGRNFIISHSSLMEALGKNIGSEKKNNIDKAIEKALKEYKKTFQLLGKE